MIPRIHPIIWDWTEEFEKEFNKYIGGIKAFSATRGREALYIILKALEIEQGDEVVVIGNTCNSVYVSIRRTGAIPTKKPTPKTKAIIITHLFGIPRDFEKEDRIPIIEDCAQCIGGKINGRIVGSIGDISFFSFGFDKPISTNEGGMIIVNNPRYLEKIHLFPRQPIDQTRALMGLKQLEQIEIVNETRNYLAEIYQKNLKKEFEIWEVPKGAEPVYLRFPVFNRSSCKTEKITKIMREHGYDIRGWGGIKDLLCLPVHPYMLPEEAEDICEILNSI